MGDNQRDPEELVQLFNRLFQDKENTILLMGAKEPFYRASTKGEHAQINAREDYFSSALHEISHWSIAGKKRRKLDDFGYWYFPDGRNKIQQRAFEEVEVKPQAIEWLLSLACGHDFHFSADNLAIDSGSSNDFKNAVKEQAKYYLNNGLPDRAQLMFEHLLAKYHLELNIIEETIFAKERIWVN